MSPSLPTELLHHIAEYNHADRDFLLNCSLVHSAFTALCQKHLFSAPAFILVFQFPKGKEPTFYSRSQWKGTTQSFEEGATYETSRAPPSDLDGQAFALDRGPLQSLMDALKGDSGDRLRSHITSFSITLAPEIQRPKAGGSYYIIPQPEISEGSTGLDSVPNYFNTAFSALIPLLQLLTFLRSFSISSRFHGLLPIGQVDITSLFQALSPMPLDSLSIIDVDGILPLPTFCRLKHLHIEEGTIIVDNVNLQPADSSSHVNSDLDPEQPANTALESLSLILERTSGMRRTPPIMFRSLLLQGSVLVGNVRIGSTISLPHLRELRYFSVHPRDYEMASHIMRVAQASFRCFVVDLSSRICVPSIIEEELISISFSTATPGFNNSATFTLPPSLHSLIFDIDLTHTAEVKTTLSKRLTHITKCLTEWDFNGLQELGIRVQDLTDLLEWPRLKEMIGLQLGGWIKRVGVEEARDGEKGDIGLSPEAFYTPLEARDAS
ncbi:hypothetical protein CC1G_08022 [Coprinopsis cinerea okayama7|uniref:F-box domain-containing protein n=1 Tax=Coprinopsis cinerea (strain Okayama-7 / 130 / ATCC MYA-4618 / FGSC 9003) TaxID=240176 RepID=A8NQA5_COPC7|nr:hypothetical protein CC1G_08022 [Coprinopsis cinerea okayama7\|eukprot:XP_001835513.2 hypothetical protein CC1G_08022 [Coprinopsis cinerea okayama7\